MAVNMFSICFFVIPISFRQNFVKKTKAPIVNILDKQMTAFLGSLLHTRVKGVAFVLVIKVVRRVLSRR
jgi:hypothetical protein